MKKEKSGINEVFVETKENLLNELGMILMTFLNSNNFTIEEITACICSAYKQREKFERMIELVEILKEGEEK